MPQQQPRRRPPASYVPLTALACTAVLAVVLPVAGAAAGPAPSPSPPPQPHSQRSPHPAAAASPSPSPAASPSRETGRGATGAGGPSSSCGPEVASGDGHSGLSAQTCLLSQDGRTWARTYYRNATGEPLSAALTLTRPDGGSLRAGCAMSASGGPDGSGVCETPREKSRTGPGGYAATVEAGTPDGERLLLRSGVNSRTR